MQADPIWSDQVLLKPLISGLAIACLLDCILFKIERIKKIYILSCVIINLVLLYLALFSLKATITFSAFPDNCTSHPYTLKYFLSSVPCFHLLN